DGNQAVANGLLTPSGPAGNVAGSDGPSEEMQQQMAELQRLDKESDTLPADKQAANLEKRITVLQKLAQIAPAADRDQWFRQLIDVIIAAVQSGNYAEGIAALEGLEKQLIDANADQEIIAHAVLQRMWGQFQVSQRDPAADAGKIQEKWLADLQAFVGKYPKSSDAAEALFQLGIYQEFMGKSDEAAKSYQQLVSNFP